MLRFTLRQAAKCTNPNCKMVVHKKCLELVECACKQTP
jgi:hypothetical protein